MSVELRYNGARMPPHLAAGMDFDGVVRFEHGKTVSVTDDVAGRAIASWGPGTSFPCVEVVSGTPRDHVAMSGAGRTAMLREAERIETFGLDPARALAGVPSLGADAKKATVADVTAGKHDAALGALALWAQLDGKADLAAACVRRGEHLRLSPAKR